MGGLLAILLPPPCANEKELPLDRKDTWREEGEADWACALLKLVLLELFGHLTFVSAIYLSD